MFINSADHIPRYAKIRQAVPSPWPSPEKELWSWRVLAVAWQIRQPEIDDDEGEEGRSKKEGRENERRGKRLRKRVGENERKRDEFTRKNRRERGGKGVIE